MEFFKDIKKIELSIFTIFSLLIAYYLDKNYMPSEDASILFRYSENLIDTGVISYNVNGPRTEGATDFLWMIILSIFYFLGFNIYFSSVLINLFSLYLIINLIRKYYSLSNVETYALIFLHFSITHTYAALGGFSVLFVELFLVLVIINFLKGNVINTLLFSFIGCLIRPDFILFIIIPNVINLFKNFNLKNIKFFIIFIFLNLAYFYARYKYFDFFLPLPFYIKNQWNLFSNIEWGRQIIIFSPALLVLFFSGFSKIFKKNILIFISITLLATAYYTNQILYQNVGYRFYFYFTVFCIFIIYEIRSEVKNFRNISKIIIIIISFFSIAINYSQNFNSFKFLNKKIDLYIFAKDLNGINKDHKLNLATTESGLIPYYSKINTVDLFGLNSVKFAKKPADGNLFLSENFDLIVINSSITGDDCESLKVAIEKSRNLELKIANRNDSWSKFTSKLLFGIDVSKYDSYLVSYPTNIFINKKSNAYQRLSDAIKKIESKKCNY